MFTAKDLEHIAVWRNELTANRTVEIYMTVEGDEETDPFTGEVIGAAEESYVFDAIVTERASRIDNERKLNEVGSVVIEDTIWVSVSYDQLQTLAETDKGLEVFTEIEYDNFEYIVVGADKKGIGAFNRVEFLAKRKV